MSRYSAKKRRERDSDTITRSEKYRSEGETTDYDKISKGSDGTKSIYLKKRLWDDEKNKLGNVVSSVDQVRYLSPAISVFLLHDRYHFVITAFSPSPLLNL